MYYKHIAMVIIPAGVNRIMRLLALMLLLVSSLSFAQTPKQEGSQQVVANPKVEQLQQLNNEISSLQKEQEGAVKDGSSAADVIGLQILNKNDERRDILASLISEKDSDKKQLLKEVNHQVVVINQFSTFLDEKLKRDQEKLDDAKDADKLIALKKLAETRQYSTLILNEEWQNYQWLEKLDKPAPKAVKELTSKVEHRLEFISASLNFDSQALDLASKQLKSATESEKSALQMSQILAQRQVDNDTENLKQLIEIADKVGIDTAKYKKQLFEQTGNVTDDLLNSKVIWSIASGWTTDLKDWLFDNLPQMLFKVFVFVLIIFAFKTLKNIVRKMVKRAVSAKNLKMSMLMQEFFISMSGKAVFAIGILIALSQVGLNLAPILTGFGVAGIIVGFALQDTLSNFAAGMMLLIYRPFDVGDLVEAGGITGKVSHMSLVNTTIKTFSNEMLMIPNSKIWGDIIKNVTHEKVRRVDMVFGIGYGDDIEKTERVLNEIVSEHPAVLRSPEPTIKLHTLNSSSVDFIVRPWVKTDDYWDVYWDITREVKMRFDQENISIPFPQQDVHLHMVEKALEAKDA